jgi:hypothetical protein
VYVLGIQKVETNSLVYLNTAAAEEVLLLALPNSKREDSVVLGCDESVGMWCPAFPVILLPEKN